MTSLEPKTHSEFNRLVTNRYWRLNNLYKIIDKEGKVVTFKMNWAQEKFCREIHYRNLILKSRQIGFSTVIDLFFLDECLWEPNTRAGIVADNEENARLLFRRVKFAYENLPPICKISNWAKQENAQEYSFQNGSHMRVATSMRSSTLSHLHVSEYGKICARYPEKAREIITGTFESVPSHGMIFVESTAEGVSGYFHDMCISAEKKLVAKEPLTHLDFRFQFFPWWQHPEYRLNDIVPIEDKLLDYFQTLESRNIFLQPEQKYWYAKKYEVLGDDMRREYCSTSDEVWLATNVGYYYSEQMADMYEQGRITAVPYDPAVVVDTFWDIGVKDSTCILFAQKTGDSYRFIDYYENSGEGCPFYMRELQKKPYVFGKHYAPHDINVKEFGTGLTRWEQFAKLGLKFQIVPKLDEQSGIDALRNMLVKVYADSTRCDRLIKSLKHFQKSYNTKLQRFNDTPLNDWSNHAADAARYCAVIYMQTRSQAQDKQLDAAMQRFRPF